MFDSSVHALHGASVRVRVRVRVRVMVCVCARTRALVYVLLLAVCVCVCVPGGTVGNSVLSPGPRWTAQHC